MGATRLESGFTDPDAPSSLMKGHLDYFYPASTSALNITGVVDGSSVSLFVKDVEHTTYLGTKVVRSPIEDTPENYVNGNLKPITTASLEE
ncbi:hypothetical protein C4K88_03320 [Arthrobacter pityocampae]|uniref:Uncharacterized protein n=2 Tax=Arthrobacter pityocampae TaxID=547334 RepID=A0A2S5J246_9MICC|nr:hypothetical protein C4K88_03320 [Arthrobacter pityocampae]